MLEEYPRDWSSDLLSDHLQAIHDNTVSAYIDLKDDFNRLVGISEVFQSVSDTDFDEADYPIRMFIPRTNAAFIGSTSLCLGGMLPESYMVQRGCLESALYGSYVSQDVERFKIWINRHKDNECEKRVRNEFTSGRIFHSLAKIHSHTHSTAKVLYNRLIGYGGHPNSMAILPHLEIGNEGYLHNIRSIGTEFRYQNCVRSLMQVGVCAIEILRHSDSKHFEIEGLIEKIDQLKTGL